MIRRLVSGIALVAALTASRTGAAGEGDAAACSRLNDAGRYAESLPRCAAALAAARARPGERDALAEALNAHGLALEMTGSRAEARAAYEEALALHRAAGARDREALVLSNLAALAIGAGDYGAALDRLAEEETVARGAGDAPWTAEEIRIVRINRAVALEQLGAYREALVELRQVDAAAGEHDAAREANLAVLYRNLGDPRRALRLLDSAAAAFEKAGDRAALANVHLNRGLAWSLDLADPAAARVELDRALALAREAGDRAEELRTLEAAGELALASGDLDLARRHLTAALELARASDARAGEWTALAALGRVEARAGDGDLALARLTEAERLLESASAGVGDGSLGASLRRDLRRLYATAVDLLGERALAGDRAAAAEAVAWSERLRARELLDRLAGAPGAAAPLDAAALDALGKRDPALAFFVGERRVWRFRLDAGGVTVADAGEPRDIATRVARIHALLERGLEPGAEDLATLAAALLPADLGAGADLLLVPDGILFYLPFALLPDPASPGRRLVDSRALRDAPSLSVLERLRDSGAPPRWRLAAFAAPEPGAGAGGTAALLAARYGLPPIPGSAREAERAAKLLGEPSVVEVGREATEANLRGRAAEGASVLHLAAHTLVDEGLERGCAIFLTPGSAAAGETSDDGRLTPAEIARSAMRADLVVLSGCRTALENGGGPSSGNVLASLAGSFLAAGARGVVASLWAVGDAATAALMEQLYFELGRGVEPAEALRRAQARLAADPRWGAPHRWAAFVLIGRPPAIAPGASRRRWAAVAGFGLLVAGVALLWRSRRAGSENRGRT